MADPGFLKRGPDIMSYNQHKLYKNNQKMTNCERPLGMLHFSLILHHNMGMPYTDEPFNMVFFFLPKAFFKKGTLIKEGKFSFQNLKEFFRYSNKKRRYSLLNVGLCGR